MALSEKEKMEKKKGDAEKGNRVAIVRNKLNMSQKEFALGMRVGAATIGGIERGNQSITPRMMLQMESTYGISPQYILQGEGDPFISFKSKKESSDEWDLIHTLYSSLDENLKHAAIRMLKELCRVQLQLNREKEE